MEPDQEIYCQPGSRIRPVEGYQAAMQHALVLDIHDSDHTETRGSGGSNPFPQDPELSAADGERTCWICFAASEDNPHAYWVQPCQCRGDTKWVHQSCLYRWIDEKQMGNRRHPVICQQCQTEYIMVFPQMNPLARVLEKLDYAVRLTCPFLVIGMFLCCIYWVAVTYGCITVIQVVGQDRALQLMENKVILLVGFPFIPVGLMLFRLVRWKDVVLRAMRSVYNILRKFPFFHRTEEPEAAQGDLDDSSDSSSISSSTGSFPPILRSPSIAEPFYISRLICGAFFLPTLVTTVGNVFFRSMDDPLQRTIYGGIAYIGIKGLLKMYLNQKLYLRRLGRNVLNYTDGNVRMDDRMREDPADGSQNPRANANYNRNQGPNDDRQLAGFYESMDDSLSVPTTDSEGGDASDIQVIVQ
ncbi:E3 ubiquitin-protein ligase MARCH5 [Drosophila sechellia]|uniref:E3 ubiquitin-protein ligase MARCH5 n=1 Tax=Drosophila sechellia TaxID=7238 RepID=UPI0013DE5771|nr:E3 ubiquitin-protein ligase MARCH5 [Drosophila sechellia]